VARAFSVREAEKEIIGVLHGQRVDSGWIQGQDQARANCRRAT
jgi:hypothetical protein